MNDMLERLLTKLKNIREKLFGKMKVSTLSIILVIIIISGIRLVAAFPVISFNGNNIRVFSFDHMVSRNFYFDTRPMGYFRVRVLGNHVLETEYGEIVLRHFSRISAQSNTVFEINVENFRAGQASHNLTILGITMPQNISIGFNRNHRISIMGLYRQEIIVSDNLLEVEVIRLNAPMIGGAIDIGFFATGYFVLTDSTQIYFNPSFQNTRLLRHLNIYLNGDHWRMTGRTSVKRPGETDFTMYRSITFGANWGEFIRGELFE